MSRRRVEYVDDEKIGRQVDDELSSDSSSSSEPKPKRKAVKKPPTRIPAGKRTDIIAKKMQGIEDPEFTCTQNPGKKTWSVKRRRFPLDQTPQVNAQVGSLPSPLAPVTPVAPVAHPAPSADMNVTWLNNQTVVNDSLKRTLEELSGKYEKLASKYEEKKKKVKKVKKAKAQMTEQEQEELLRDYTIWLREEDRKAALAKSGTRQQSAPQANPARVGRYPQARPSIFNY
jgi:hypothetical protein